jgi:4-amino-4-deoxy-L-arabinose transferase-like glycosyltransferase
MLAIGRYHLDWGSADQPPLTPALAALMHTVAPAARPALAFPAALATGCAVVLAGLIAREFGCDRRAQVVTALAQATGLWTSLAGHWLTPYALEPAQWLLLMWLLIRWVRLRDDRLLIAFGCVAGIAALTKLEVILLCSVLLVAVAVAGPRELLRRPMLWLGGAIAAVIALPTLIWQQVHGWPQLQMASVVGGEAEALYGGRGGHCGPAHPVRGGVGRGSRRLRPVAFTARRRDARIPLRRRRIRVPVRDLRRHGGASLLPRTLTVS